MDEAMTDRYCDLRKCLQIAEVMATLADSDDLAELYLCGEHFRALMTSVADATLDASALERV